MPQLDIRLDGDEAFADPPGLQDRPRMKGELLRIATLDGGMESGRPSVALAILTEEGEIVFAETSVRLFQMAAAAITGKYGNLTGMKATVTLE